MWSLYDGMTVEVDQLICDTHSKTDRTKNHWLQFIINILNQCSYLSSRLEDTAEDTSNQILQNR